jgi:hypothetical protein
MMNMAELFEEACARAGIPVRPDTPMDGNATYRIPAASSRIGDLIIECEEDEITVYVGHHTHCHFMGFVQDGSDRTAEEAVEQALDYIAGMLADKWVIWSGLIGGGTYHVHHPPSLFAIKGHLWSGKPFPPEA